jgi:hypothetical protein
MSDSSAAVAAPSSVESTAPVTDAVSTEAADLEAEEAAEAEVKAKAKAPASTKRKYSPKVNGRNVDLELDPNDDAEMMKYLQKALASDEKFQEAAALRKNVEQLVNELKANPRGVLSHPDLGIDLKKFAEDILNEEIQELQKTPQQKQLEALQKQLEGEKKQREMLEEGKRSAEMARLEEQAFKQFDDDITASLEKYPNLPKSPYVVKRIADTMIEAINLGYKDATVKDIMPIVESQINSEMQKMFETMPEDLMEKLIGSNNLSRLRKTRLAKMKKVDTAAQVKSTGKTSTTEAKEKDKTKPIKFNDIFGRF